jgi:hypothetical protein
MLSLHCEDFEHSEVTISPEQGNETSLFLRLPREAKSDGTPKNSPIVPLFCFPQLCQQFDLFLQGRSYLWGNICSNL